MQNFNHQLQMLGMDPYQVGEVIPINPYSRQFLNDSRLFLGFGCGGFGCGGFGCGGFGCGGFGCGGCFGFSCFGLGIGFI